MIDSTTSYHIPQTKTTITISTGRRAVYSSQIQKETISHVTIIEIITPTQDDSSLALTGPFENVKDANNEPIYVEMSSPSLSDNGSPIRSQCFGMYDQALQLMPTECPDQPAMEEGHYQVPRSPPRRVEATQPRRPTSFKIRASTPPPPALTSCKSRQSMQALIPEEESDATSSSSTTYEASISNDTTSLDKQASKSNPGDTATNQVTQPDPESDQVPYQRLCSSQSPSDDSTANKHVSFSPAPQDNSSNLPVTTNIKHAHSTAFLPEETKPAANNISNRYSLPPNQTTQSQFTCKAPDNNNKSSSTKKHGIINWFRSKRGNSPQKQSKTKKANSKIIS
ncbi:hypothetical protein NEHOM01_1037 [Nematocida homosporus]|uniref:uncharacterized protein n=1 Tax=Nematocida homosporus TaxID=1912981 RepID=UPI00221EBB36|nr:uncharacterized protein NEHOM01_1037 [Nematocida homosporus]KAI5185745.1 hypothetical protein NEHOM01_1037 [Nematocida homosporus]